MIVRMIHPNLPGQDIHVPPDSVQGHERSGWRVDEHTENPTEEPDTGQPETPPDVEVRKQAPARRTTTPTGKE